MTDHIDLTDASDRVNAALYDGGLDDAQVAELSEAIRHRSQAIERDARTALRSGTLVEFIARPNGGTHRFVGLQATVIRRLPKNVEVRLDDGTGRTIRANPRLLRKVETS